MAKDISDSFLNQLLWKSKSKKPKMPKRPKLIKSLLYPAVKKYVQMVQHGNIGDTRYGKAMHILYTVRQFQEELALDANVGLFKGQIEVG